MSSEGEGGVRLHFLFKCLLEPFIAEVATKVSPKVFPGLSPHRSDPLLRAKAQNDFPEYLFFIACK